MGVGYLRKSFSCSVRWSSFCLFLLGCCCSDTSKSISDPEDEPTDDREQGAGTSFFTQACPIAAGGGKMMICMAIRVNEKL